MSQHGITIPMAQYAIANPDLLSRVLDQHAELDWQRMRIADLDQLVTKQGEMIEGQQRVIAELEERAQTLRNDLILSADRIHKLESCVDDQQVRRGAYKRGT